MNFICDDKQTNKQTNKQTDKQTNKQTNREDILNVVNYIPLVPSGKYAKIEFSSKSSNSA